MKVVPLDITGKAGWLNTFTCNQVDLYNPLEHTICIEDIAHGLSNICRFGGQTRKFYSVAQHCCLVSYLAPVHIRFEALMHDAQEAYLGDVIKPLKNIISAQQLDSLGTIPGIYKELEKRFEVVIADKFGIDFHTYGLIKPYDIRALEIEHGYFFLEDERTFLKCFNSEEPCWTPTIAKEMFLSTFNELRK